MEEQIGASHSAITIQEKTRADLIPNLANAAEKFASHEKITLTQVTEARASLMKGDHENALALLNAAAEDYPELASYGAFKEVMTAMSTVEHDIANHRASYDRSVRNYNRKIRSFPTNVILNMLGYEALRPEYLNFEGNADAPVVFGE